MSLTGRITLKKGSGLKRLCARLFLGQFIAELARKLYERGDINKAVRFYKLAIMLPLGSGWPLVKLADLLKNPEYKLKLFKRAIRIDNHVWAYTGAIKILLSQRRLSEAESFFKDLNKTFPVTVWRNNEAARQEVGRIEKQLDHEKKSHEASLAKKFKIKNQVNLK